MAIGAGFDDRIDSSEYSVELYKNGKFIKQIEVYDNLWAAESYIERNRNTNDKDKFYHIIRIDYDADGNELGFETIYSEEDE